MIRPEDVTDAMAEAAWGAYVAERWASPRVRLIYAIAAAINASGCVLVPKSETLECCHGVRYPHECRECQDVIDARFRSATADPRQQALDRMAENAQELGLYNDGKEKGDE